ncbi:MAG: hypothetical protein PHW62_06045 [Candidatus Ratteibacteria bacterium]|nr:hypothetical protein [Candidatus Ratteibacteria bacterium]
MSVTIQQLRMDGKRSITRTMNCNNCFKGHGEILLELCDYDWSQAFEYADFIREDVEKVIKKCEGEHDGNDWIGIFQLKNGKIAGLSAGCDYTGWD